MIIKFKIPGPAVGKSQVPRKQGQYVFAKSKGGITNTKQTREYMNFVRTLAKIKAPPEPWECAVAVTIEYTIRIPKNWDAINKALAREGHIFATVEPDGDNVSKAICDAMSKVIYKDDRQIVKYVIEKRYADEPETWVAIEALEEVQTQTRLL